MRIARLLSGFAKALLASLITGSVLGFLGITTRDLFPGMAIYIDRLTDAVELTVNWLVIWLVPNIIVGMVVIIPVWIILLIFGPRR
ncbi:hypothetical protein SAMN04488056_103116 [Cohaesibacter marisflavi]|uniref:Uncharacterized protein n=1 Tax=Cohaesibacter marisflavi TaxID=655353 RepID=A0A1I5EC50_9HYPH|nr:hypothetical protein [Cohaesibacter marisflavi]SFO08836.1 hypothetical protein SAMN04488056_103116 [Cohaesibacter marisflavi]